VKLPRAWEARSAMCSLPPDTLDRIPIAERWYTVDGVTNQWPVIKPRTTRNAIARGDLRAARIGIGRRKIVIKGAWVLEWLERAATPQEIVR
jgi:hypothetical protein